MVLSRPKRAMATPIAEVTYSMHGNLQSWVFVGDHTGMRHTEKGDIPGRGTVLLVQRHGNSVLLLLTLVLKNIENSLYY